jgi:hypothetical protein
MTAETRTLSDHLLAGRALSPIVELSSGWRRGCVISADASEVASKVKVTKIQACCRFPRASDIDRCAAWLKDELLAWAAGRFGPPQDVEVAIDMFSPVVRIGCIVPAALPC